MNTIIVIGYVIGALVVSLLIAFFTSNWFLRSSLLDRKNDLEKLPSDEEISALIKEINPYVPKKETKAEKAPVDEDSAIQSNPYEPKREKKDGKPSEDTTLKSGKIGMIKLIRKSSRLLSQKVPCYFGRGRRIPEYYEILSEDSLCSKCTVSNCAFRQWRVYQPQHLRLILF